MAKIKEQNKTPEKELNKMETSDVPEAEFKTLLMRKLNELRGKIKELSENFNKETGNIEMDIENMKRTSQDKEHTVKITKQKTPNQQ